MSTTIARLVPRIGRGRLTILVIALIVLAAVQLGNPHSYLSETIQRASEVGSGPSASLTDLTGIDQLRDRFNGDTGHPRLILLLSPT